MANITGDDVAKAIVGFIAFVVTGVTTWLSTTVFKLKEDALLAKTQIAALEVKVSELKTEVSEVKKDQITRECIREEIEGALEKRDRQAEQRNEERRHTRDLEMRALVSEELEKLVPRIVREIKGTTGVQKRPSGDGKIS